jgi:hypothetical protein
MAKTSTTDRKKLSFDFSLTDPLGKPVEDKTAGQVLGELLMRAVLKDESKIAKYFDWATNLAKNQPIEVDSYLY